MQTDPPVYQVRYILVTEDGMRRTYRCEYRRRVNWLMTQTASDIQDPWNHWIPAG